jgi:hypothetical protein
MKLLAIISVLGILIVVLFLGPENKGRYYDCRLSEISPDFPVDVREECRRIRLEEYKNNKSNYI